MARTKPTPLDDPKGRSRLVRAFLYQSIYIQSAEEHRYVAADVVQAGVAGVDVVVLAEAGQGHDEQDEAGLHDEPPG